MVAATITSMVPQGMVLTATIAFMLGAIALSRRGTIDAAPQAPVETMAAIDVICTDKTGTLTTNHLRLETIDFVDDLLTDSEDDPCPAARFRMLLRGPRQQKPRRHPGGHPGKGPALLLEQIPFQSAKSLQRVRARDCEEESLLVLGAVEALRGRVRCWPGNNNIPGSQVDERLSPALALDPPIAGDCALLLLAEADERLTLADGPRCPTCPLRPLALVSLGDELRPDAGFVLEALSRRGRGSASR